MNFWFNLCMLGRSLCLTLCSSRRGARTPWRGGFSSFGSPALEHRLSSWCASSVAPLQVGSSWIRDRTCASCIGRRIPYHWATRKALCVYTFLNYPRPLVTGSSFAMSWANSQTGKIWVGLSYLHQYRYFKLLNQKNLLAASVRESVYTLSHFGESF